VICSFFAVLIVLLQASDRQIRGTLEAPPNRSVWLDRGLQEWITFEGVDRLHVLGGGTLNGNGQQWWTNSCKVNRSMVRYLPLHRRKFCRVRGSNGPGPNCIAKRPENVRRRKSLYSLNISSFSLDDPLIFSLPIDQLCVTGPTVPPRSTSAFRACLMSLQA
jgi:hypothetical protein